jgi:hypothetical protein
MKNFLTFDNWINENRNENRLLQSLADEFNSNYSDTKRVYHEMRDSAIHQIGRIRSINRAAADWWRLSRTETPDEFERRLILSYVPWLKTHDWPEPYSKKWADAQQDFLQSFLETD